MSFSVLHPARKSKDNKSNIGLLGDSKNNLLIEEINKIDDILSFKFTKNEQLIKILDETFDKSYYSELKKLTLNNPIKNSFKIVYSPQHGTALNGIKEILTSLGYNLHLVESQCSFDPAFSPTTT